MSNTKKRRAGIGAAEGNNNSNNNDELVAIKSTLDELVHQNRKQNENMASMLQMVKGMQENMIQLQEKCTSMEKSIQDKQDLNTGTLFLEFNEKYDSMESTVRQLIDGIDDRLDEVEEKQNYHKLLLRNQKWRSTVAEPPEEYWNSLGENQERINAARGFMTTMRIYTRELRQGTGEGYIDIDMEEEVPFPFNEAFLPHWKEFADAIEHYQHHLQFSPEIDSSDLRLCNLELSDTVLDLLSKALRQTWFHRFTLANNSFGQEGIGFTLNYLERNHIIKVLTLESNPIGVDNVKRLCEIINEHSSLDQLFLDECKGEDVNGYEMLKMIMTAGRDKLKLLELINNSISTGGDTFVSDFLTSNATLETLSLPNNQLDDNDAVAIAGALKHNTTLRTLKITDNNITNSGWVALRKAVNDETSLNSAADSNHTCHIEIDSDVDDEYDYEGVGDINGDSESKDWYHSKFVRHKKIYTILSERNKDDSNVKHFEDIPVELLPHMIRSIHRYSNYYHTDNKPQQGTLDAKPLSVVYEILKMWDKSLGAFESLSALK